MKKFIALVGVFLLSNIIHAQSTVKFDIDSQLFTSELVGMFSSKDNKAVFGAVLVPNNFDELIKDASSELNNYEDNVEIGFLQNSKIFTIRKVEKRNGEDYMILALMKKGDENQTINMMSGFPMNKKDIYYPAIIKAAKTARIEE